MRYWSERPRTALLLTLVVVGVGVQAQENVALGAAVTFVIPPNYAYSKHLAGGRKQFPMGVLVPDMPSGLC